MSWPRDLYVFMYIYVCMGGGGLICLDASLLHKDTTGEPGVLLFFCSSWPYYRHHSYCPSPPYSVYASILCALYCGMNN